MTVYEEYFSAEKYEDRIEALDKIKTSDEANYLKLKKINELRYQVKKGAPVTDLFMQAFLAINAAASAGVSLFFKKNDEKQLKRNMISLGISAYDGLEEDEKKLLEKEWGNFANTYISISLESRSYGTTMFGIVPMSKEKVLLKMSSEIETVTFEYPSIFHLEESFSILKQIMQDTFKDYTSAKK